MPSRLLLVALIACGRTAPLPITGRAPTSGPRTSCPLPVPTHASQNLLHGKYLGRIGDRSWEIVTHVEHDDDLQQYLAALRDDGTLGLTKLPLAPHKMLETAIDGTHLWLVTRTQGLGLGDEILWDADLAGETPQIRQAEALAKKTIPGANSFAIGTTRALFFTYGGGAGIQLWDRVNHVPVASEPFTPVGIDDPPVRCVRDHCFLIGVVGDGPTRRLTSIRFAPGGTVTRDQLADDHLGDYLIIPDGDASLAVWTSYSRPGLYARKLDATGAPAAPEVALVAARARDPQYVPAPDGPQLAYKADDGWWLAHLSPDRARLERVQHLTTARHTFLTAAALAEGTLATVFDSDVPIDTPGSNTKAVGVFAPTGGTAGEPPFDAMFGKTQVALAPFPMVAPGYAGVLAIKQGYDPGGELVMLRAPCR